MPISPIATTSDTVPDVPRRPPVPMHSFRCPDDLWAEFKAAAEANGEYMTEALQRVMRAYVKRTERKVEQ